MFLGHASICWAHVTMLGTSLLSTRPVLCVEVGDKAARAGDRLGEMGLVGDPAVSGHIVALHGGQGVG
jgi:hypothetical protein